jgi:hypothetical protein
MRTSFIGSFCREEHIHRKIDATLKEAKEKLAKGDKKGTDERVDLSSSSSLKLMRFLNFL